MKKEAEKEASGVERNWECMGSWKPSENSVSKWKECSHLSSHMRTESGTLDPRWNVHISEVKDDGELTKSCPE